MKRFLPLLLVLASCQLTSSERETGQMAGFAPVYAPRNAADVIGTEGARLTTNPGKIYAYGSWLFQVEQRQGIHIIDNHNPREAKKVAFLKVPLASEIAIKSGYLYTNNVADLVVFDLANAATPQLVHRIKDAFPLVEQSHPPVSNTFFECPDPAKGIVVAWEQKTLANPKCRR